MPLEASVSPVSAMRKTIGAMPAIPVIWLSTTQVTRQAATPASMALPPDSRICRPAWAESWWPAATAWLSPVAFGRHGWRPGGGIRIMAVLPRDEL